MPATAEIVAHANTAKNIANPQPVAGITSANPPANVFKENPGKGLVKRTFTDKLTIGSGADQINLYYFGPAHTGGDAFVEFPAHRIMHIGDTFPNKGLPIMDKTNGGSGVEYANTIRKAVKGVPNIDAIINGHTAAQTTPADMLRFADFVQEFVTHRASRQEGGQDRRADRERVVDAGEVHGLQRRAADRARHGLRELHLRRDEVGNYESTKDK